MSLAKLKKAELVAWIEESEFDIDLNCTKAELLDALEREGVTTENDDSPSTRESKIERQARLKARK